MIRKIDLGGNARKHTLADFIHFSAHIFVVSILKNLLIQSLSYPEDNQHPLSSLHVHAIAVLA